jgi:hypothetical protein
VSVSFSPIIFTLKRQQIKRPFTIGVEACASSGLFGCRSGEQRSRLTKAAMGVLGIIVKRDSIADARQPSL